MPALDTTATERLAINKAARAVTAPQTGPASPIVKYFAPVGFRGFQITQPFGQRPDGEFHTGVDIGVGSRTDVSAISATDGDVVQAGFVTRSDGSPSYGNLVVVRDHEGYLHYYAHLSAFAVQVGQHVSAGTPLGVVGATGRATGVHLHYEVRDPAGQPVDPSVDLREPISGQHASAVAAPSTNHLYNAPTQTVPNSYGDQLDTAPQTHGDLGNFVPVNLGFDADTVGISTAVADVLGLAPQAKLGVSRALDSASLRLKAMGVNLGN